jgi:hypothetical protein
VSVVGVPEIPETAKNHGVLVGKRTVSDDRNVSSCIATHYLQKPTIQEMEVSGAIFINKHDNDSNSESSEKAVYIDTGVVIISGTAVIALLSLLDEPLVNICTSKGLFPDNTQSKSVILSDINADETVISSEAPKALRLELYSDILHALALSENTNDISTYFSRIGIPQDANRDDPYISALQVIWKTLHKIPMYLIYVPNGRFYHLGTSSELLELLSYCNNDNDEDMDDSDKEIVSTERSFNIKINKIYTIEEKKMEIFSKKYGLGKFINSSIVITENRKSYNISNRSVVELKGVSINCLYIINPNKIEKNSDDNDINKYEYSNFSIGEKSLVEHSILSGEFSIGMFIFIYIYK